MPRLQQYPRRGRRYQDGRGTPNVLHIGAHIVPLQRRILGGLKGGLDAHLDPNYLNFFDEFKVLVRSRRLELPRPFGHNDLNVARLPVPPRPHISRGTGGAGTWQEPALSKGFDPMQHPMFMRVSFAALK